MLQDLQHAIRTLRKNPLFAAIAMLSLAVGIGANTAIFSMLDRLLLRSLPVKDPGQLVQLELPGPRSGNILTDRPFSYPMYKSLRDGNATLSSLAAQFLMQASFSSGDRSEFVSAQLVSGNWAETFGVKMAVGRSLGPEDDVTPGGHPVVVLLHGFWERRFGADAGILNKTILLNNRQMTVIGVTAPGFRGTDVVNPVELMLPLSMQKLLMPDTAFPMESPRFYFLHLFGRVKTGVPVEAVSADLNRVVAPVLKQEAELLTFQNPDHSKRFLGKQFVLHPAAAGNLSGREQIGLAMWLLAGLVGSLLLITCANVANLLLARATARRREIAVRISLGANRGQLIRMVLAESLVLAAGAGLLGLLVAQWTGYALNAFVDPSASGSLPLAEVSDGRILLFTAALSLVAGLIFGAGPAWAATRFEVAPSLKDGAGNLSGSGAAGWMRRGLIVFQVAVSLLLLTAAALFLTTLRNLRHVNPGFETAHLIAFTVNPSLNGYDLKRQDGFYARLKEELSSLPQVESVSMAAEPLLADSVSQSSILVEGFDAAGSDLGAPLSNEVGPGFFRTMKIPLLAGREFEDSDRRGAPEVAIVSRAFAETYFKGRDPIGRKIGFSGERRGTYMTIVGVVQEPRQRDLRDEDSKRQVYVPSAQCRRAGNRWYYLRTAAPLETIAPLIRATVTRMDSTLPVDGMRTMQRQLEMSLTLERLVSTLCGAFGLVATLLAAMGLYGVMAFHVARRTREIGIRIALGAPRQNVLWLVMREAAVLSGIGIAIGIPLSVALSQFTTGFVFGVQPTNFWVYAAAIVLLIATAVLASLMPARRATKIDPIRALRYE